MSTPFFFRFSFVLVLCIFQLTFAFGQDPSVKLGESGNFSVGGSLHLELLPVDGGFVTYLTNSTEVVPIVSTNPNRPTKKIDRLDDLLLHFYNTDLTFVHEAKVTWDGRRANRGLFAMGNKLAWVYEEQMESGEAHMWVQLLDVDGTLGERFETLKFNPKSGFIHVESAVSADKKMRGFVFSTEANNRLGAKGDDEKSELSFFVLNDQGKMISNASKTLTTSRDRLDLRSIGVTNTGKIMAAAKVFDNGKRKEKAKGVSTTKLYIYSVAPNSDEVVKTYLRTSGAYMTDFSLLAAANGEINLFGIYREVEYKSNVGTFHVIGLSEESTSVKKRKFKESHLLKLGSRVTKKSKGELTLIREFVVNDALAISDGSQAVLLEGFYGEVSETSSQYYYNEGIIISYNIDGSITSMMNVPKAQMSGNRNEPYVSMKLVEYNGKAAVVYNDNIVNLERDLEKGAKMLRLNNATAMLAYTGEKGELIRKPLFRVKEMDGMMIMPNSVEELTTGGVIFMMYGGKMLGSKTFALGKIEIEK